MTCRPKVDLSNGVEQSGHVHHELYTLDTGEGLGPTCFNPAIEVLSLGIRLVAENDGRARLLAGSGCSN